MRKKLTILHRMQITKLTMTFKRRQNSQLATIYHSQFTPSSNNFFNSFLGIQHWLHVHNLLKGCLICKEIRGKRVGGHSTSIVQITPCLVVVATEDYKTYHVRRSFFPCYPQTFSTHTIHHLQFSWDHHCQCSEDQVWETHNLRLLRCSQLPIGYMQEHHHLHSFIY